MTAVLLLAVVSFAAAPLPGEHKITYSADRSYIVQRSSGTAKVGVVLLHGAVYEDFVRKGIAELYIPMFEKLAAKRPIIVAYPVGRKGKCPWDKELVCWAMATPWEDVPFVTEVVAKLQKGTGVKRWIGVGISNGGYFLSSVIQSGEKLPLEHVVNVIGGKGWYRPLNVQWTPDLTLLAGEKDVENLKEALDLHAELTKAGFDKKAKLTLEVLPGGHGVPQERLLALLDELLSR